MGIFGSLGNSSTASGSSDPVRSSDPEVRQSGPFSDSAVILSIFTLLFLRSSTVIFLFHSCSSHACLGEHTCMSSPPAFL